MAHEGVPLDSHNFMHHSERPRELRWYHAAGILFGDWGTSRLYVLGLAFVVSGTSSFWYVAAMCAMMSLVGFAYTVICAHFPDGGGVYSAAKHRSRNLAVIGALLLIADYIITASLSAYEGFRYLLPDKTPPQYAMYAAMAAIALIGGLNAFGPRRVGLMAIGVGVCSAVLYAILGVTCLPHMTHSVVTVPTESWGMRWDHFVNVILALSGVEAIANMTGVMAEPVGKNSRKAILLVLAEVVILNLIIGYAMTAISPERMAAYPVDDQRDHMLKILSIEFVGPSFASLSSFFFGLLLLSAANTAIGDMVSIQYLMSRDKELPPAFTQLNKYGMPWVGLITATLLPVVVLFWAGANLDLLANLYAIGVVGAISINLLACGTNSKLELKTWERVTLLAVGVVTSAVEITIALDKHSALFFAIGVLTIGLTVRYVAKRLQAPEVAEPASAPLTGIAAILGKPALIPASMPRLLVPTRGHPKLLKFAVSLAKDKKAAAMIMFVREVALSFRERGESMATETMNLGKDKEAQDIFASAKKICDEAGVPMVPLYFVHDSPAEMVLDQAATLGVDAVVMGVSKRGALWKTLRGDVLQEVISYLPESIPLLIHA